MAVVFTKFPREEFRELVSDLAGFQCIWVGDAEPFIGPKNGSPGAIVRLDVKRVQKLGLDQVRREWDPTAAGGQGANKVSVGGQRVFHILFRCDSFNFDAFPGYDPLEDLRVKFRFASTIARLQGMNLAFNDAGDVIPVDLRADNRPIFSAVCEIKFNFASWQEVTDDPGGVIESVNGGHPVGDIPFTLIS